MNVHDLEQQVLDDARRAMSPSDADAGRVRAAVLAQIGVLATGSAAAIASASGAASAATATSAGVSSILVSSGVVKALVVSVFAIGGAVAVFGARHGQNRPSAQLPGMAMVTARDARTAATAAVAEVQRGSVDTSTEQTSSDSPPSRVAVSRPSLRHKGVREIEAQRVTDPNMDPNDAAERERLGEEVWLLKQADRALRQHQPEVALKRLDALASRAPNGTLMEEREAVRTLAHCMTNPGDPAKQAATLFLVQHAASVYAARIRVSCKLIPTPSDGTPLPRTLTKQEELPQ